MMKCYVAGSSCPQEYTYVDACFAHTREEAKSYLWKNSHFLREACDGDFTDVRVIRQKRSDHLLDETKKTVYIVRDLKLLRQMGWSIKG